MFDHKKIKFGGMFKRRFLDDDDDEVGIKEMFQIIRESLLRPSNVVVYARAVIYI